MARFGQLRWVPMLIRAYYDAQSRLEASKTAPQTPSNAESRDNRSKAEVPKTTNAEQKATSHPKRVQKRSIPLTGSPRRAVPSRRKYPSQSDRTLRLLRELQTANRKLESLESIERRLSQMGIALDEFNQQIAQLKAEQENIKSEGKRDEVPLPTSNTNAPSQGQGQALGAGPGPYAF